VNVGVNADIQQRIYAFLDASGLDYDVLACDPELADTAVFCERYEIPLGNSVNTILVKAKTGGERFAACVLLANTRLDVNRVVRKRLKSRRVSFAGADETAGRFTLVDRPARHGRAVRYPRRRQPLE
jgi:prolyl-tRNA editing enzyme YbaK/EbsC (Cys-tRNA(Pro) deacylase)